MSMISRGGDRFVSLDFQSFLSHRIVHLARA